MADHTPNGMQPGRCPTAAFVTHRQATESVAHPRPDRWLRWHGAGHRDDPRALIAHSVRFSAEPRLDRTMINRIGSVPRSRRRAP